MMMSLHIPNNFKVKGKNSFSESNWEIFNLAIYWRKCAIYSFDETDYFFVFYGFSILVYYFYDTFISFFTINLHNIQQYIPFRHWLESRNVLFYNHWILGLGLYYSNSFIAGRAKSSEWIWRRDEVRSASQRQARLQLVCLGCYSMWSPLEVGSWVALKYIINSFNNLPKFLILKQIRI